MTHDSPATADPFARCTICPRACGVNRHETTGLCGAPAEIRVSTAQFHRGEEPCLSGPPTIPWSGAGGSGAVFFTGCGLRCVFCQNHDISMPPPAKESVESEEGEDGRGHALTVEDMTALMLELMLAGAHNVNLVTPTHFTPLLAQAIRSARDNGLSIPVVWNSSGYETLESLRGLDGLVDIYLPDLKFMDAGAAARYADAPDYPEVATAAIREMHRQVGDITLKDGLAQRGVLTRILVLPGDAGRADLALEWVARELGQQAWVNLMDQYRPEHKAWQFPELARRVEPEVFARLLVRKRELGLRGYPD